MEYYTPFDLVDDDHDNCDALCLSLEHDPAPAELTWGTFDEAATALLATGMEQPAFYMARQFVELSLKRLQPAHGHDLVKLLDGLPAGDPLVTATDGVQFLLRSFILDLARVDPDSTAGRYGVTKGAPAFKGICCVKGSQLQRHLRELFNYVEERAYVGSDTVATTTGRVR